MGHDTSAAAVCRAHPRQTVACQLLLEGLIPLARFVGDNPIRLLVAAGALTHAEILDGVDEAARRNPPPPAWHEL
jgi:hypothetical protein